MDFQIFHRYNALARRGIVEPLKCHLCLNEVILAIHNENPAFKCLNCDKLIIPGMNTYQAIKNEVEKHS